MTDVIDPNKWGKTWERNELNMNSNGGSEQMMEGILSRLNPKYLDKFQFIPSRVRNLHDDRIRILHMHDLPWDPEASHLKDLNSRNRFHKIVFCGQWQMNMFTRMLDIPQDQKICVIDTAINPFNPEEIKKSNPKEEIRLIYTSTPQRGLGILVPVFEKLCETHDNIVLDVFSSYKIYGWPEADKQFEQLFDRCRNHPKINYHGFASNDVVREHVAKAHIFAYPSIWMECNSRSLIEAMSAGAICVHPNFAGLSDTSGSITLQYNWDPDSNVHANVFYHLMDDVIKNIQKNDLTAYLQFQKTYADYRYNWNKISNEWNMLCASLDAQYEGKDLAVPSAKFTYKTR
jgi:glycosyltransferase involved in cell wall biosynthesis